MVVVKTLRVKCSLMGHAYLKYMTVSISHNREVNELVPFNDIVDIPIAIGFRHP